MGTHPIFESDFDCLTDLEMGIVDFYSGYGSYHHNVVNKWIHIIGVPLILYTFNGMGEWAKIDIGGNSVNPILAINCLACLYYLSLHFLAGLITTSLMFLAHFGFVLDYIKTEEAAFNVFAGINVLCWIGQFVGHGIFEGRKPALFDNILQVFSAPMFVIMEVLFMIGYNPELEAQCEKAVLAKMPKKNK